MGEKKTYVKRSFKSWIAITPQPVINIKIRKHLQNNPVFKSDYTLKGLRVSINTGYRDKQNLNHLYNYNSFFYQTCAYQAMGR